jgi:hypothetical protein
MREFLTKNLQRHYGSCKKKDVTLIEKQLEEQRENYDKQLEEQRENYDKQLEEQREYYEKQIQVHKDQLEEQREKFEKEIQSLKEQLTEFKTQLFEIAKQPKTTNNVTNNNTTQNQTHTNNRNTNIINQLAIYDLNKDQITQLAYQHFNVDTFHGGPEEIAKITAQAILTDPETQKPKVTCTDISRKNFRYVDEEQEVQVDPGFQKTHGMIKEPLSKANIRVFTEYLKCDDKYHAQWRKNEDFISDQSRFSDKLIKWMV